MRYSVYNKDVKSRDEFVATPTYVQAIEIRDRSLSPGPQTTRGPARAGAAGRAFAAEPASPSQTPVVTGCRCRAAASPREDP